MKNQYDIADHSLLLLWAALLYDTVSFKAAAGAFVAVAFTLARRAASAWLLFYVKYKKRQQQAWTADNLYLLFVFFSTRGYKASTIKQ